MKKLIIVESPAKAKTINKFLGEDFIVKSSMGHIKDLPKSRLGVDIENNFAPEYKIIRGREKIVRELRDAAKKAKIVYLAPDPDREGEAIAWHLSQELGNDDVKIFRVTFNEITGRAVSHAIANPMSIDINKVDAQQTRRILDRLVGYKISPLLWKKVRKGLSAGRVQSVAVRLICEREKEIKSFIQEEYWTIAVLLNKSEREDKYKFEAELYKISDKKADLKKENEVVPLVENLKKETYIVSDINVKEKKKNPPPPFITSSLQQEAFNRFSFPAKKTMYLAQNLYEGLEIGKEGPVGLITYMRTDSYRIAPEAVEEAQGFIKENFGIEYILKDNIKRKQKPGAQDAHEAIRPTSCFRRPDDIKGYLTPDQYKLYKMIWERFIGSNMKYAIYDQTVVLIKAGSFLFRATGLVEKFKGFTIIYQEKKEDSEKEKAERLPILDKDEVLVLLGVKPEQHFTKPPARYTEATLVKELEDKGIGRPSTYAAIVDTIQERDYVRKEEKKFYPTELGELVNGLLLNSFPDIIEVGFTADMESELDKIETGDISWQKVLDNFYKIFIVDLEKATDNMRDVKKEQEKVTDIICEHCGVNMVVKWGRSGKFLACPNFPKCRNTKPWDEKSDSVAEVEVSDEVCPKCGKNMIVKKGRFGKFLACPDYPKCKSTKPILVEIGVNCTVPGCSGKIVQKYSAKRRIFFGCSRYPECKFVSWDKPVLRECPLCKVNFVWEKKDKSGVYYKCSNKECSWEEREKKEAAG